MPVPRVLSLFLVLLASSVSSPGQLTLVPRGGVWKYFSSGAPASNWNQLSFDDGQWQSAAAQFGYGEGDERTVLFDNGADAPPAIYFRQSFVVTNLALVSSGTLRLLAEDGGVVYLNGQEIARRNMPSGPVSFTTPSLPASEPNNDNLAQFGVYWYKLRAGTNVIAVEVHQQAGGSSQSSFDLEFLANIPVAAPTIAITNPAPNIIVNSGDVLLQTAAADPAGNITRVQFFTNGFLLGETSIEPFAFTWHQPPKGHYSVVARAYDNFSLHADSPFVHVQVGSDTQPKLSRGPYLQCGSTTNVVVRWRTDWVTDGVVRYGTESNLLGLAVLDPTGSIDHEIKITGLQPGTLYFYSVGSSTQTFAAGPKVFFRSAPSNPQPVRVWVVGDSGTGDTNATQVRDGYYHQTGPGYTDLFLMLGDNAYYEGTDAQYQTAVFNIYTDLLRNTVLWPTIGNHEAADDPGDYGNHAVDYFKMFTLPTCAEAGGIASGSEHYYSFDYANVHFVCLDSFLSGRTNGSPMLTWLENDLAATDKDWLIAFWHHPPYSWGTHNSDSEPELIQMRESAVPILEKYGVDLVLSGHSHVYERSFLLNGHYGYSGDLSPEMLVSASFGGMYGTDPYYKPAGGLGADRGTVYVVCGCSGQGGYPEGSQLHPAMALNHGGFGSMVLEVDGLRLNARFLRPSMDVDDQFTIDKSLPSNLPARLEVTPGVSGAKLSWPTAIPPFILENSDALGSEWVPTTTPITVVGRRNIITLETRDPQRLFRLRSAP